MTPSPAPTRMRVDQLRAELRARGLDVSGTKQVLLARLQTAIASGINGAAAHSASKSPTSASAASTLVPPASTPAKKPAPRPASQTPAAAAPTPTTNPQAPLARTSHASARPLAAPRESGTASSHRAASPVLANGGPATSTGADLPHRLVSDERSLLSSEHERKPDLGGAPAVLLAPEKMSMEDRLAARARRFGLEPEDNALLKSANLSTPTITLKNSADVASGSKGKLAAKTASSPGKGMNGDVDAGKRATRRDRNKTRVEKRERSPEPVVAEVLTPEEEAMRAKRAKRFGIAPGNVA